MMLFFGLNLDEWKVVAAICSNEDMEAMSALEIKAKYYRSDEYMHALERIYKFGDKFLFKSEPK